MDNTTNVDIGIDRDIMAKSRYIPSAFLFITFKLVPPRSALFYARTFPSTNDTRWDLNMKVARLRLRLMLISDYLLAGAWGQRRDTRDKKDKSKRASQPFGKNPPLMICDYVETICRATTGSRQWRRSARSELWKSNSCSLTWERIWKLRKVFLARFEVLIFSWFRKDAKLWRRLRSWGKRYQSWKSRYPPSRRACLSPELT